jgi:hypothetical protein
MSDELQRPGNDRADPRRLSLPRRLLYSAVVLVAFFTVAELALRALGLGERPVVGKLEFGYRDGIPEFDADGIEQEGRIYRLPLFERDTWLFWRPRSDTPFTGTEGLRNPVPSTRKKPPNGYRIAVLGDSCSFLGRELYVNRFAKLLAEHDLSGVDVVNASCPGYSSFQGARRVEEVMAWRPDLLIVYFGWNDHWKSPNGNTDAYVAASLRIFSGPERVFQHSRIYWALARLLAPARAPSRSAGAPMRVPF